MIRDLKTAKLEFFHFAGSVDDAFLWTYSLHFRSFSARLARRIKVCVLYRTLLHAAGAQEEKSLGASGGRPAILRRLRTDAQRIAYRRLAFRPVPRRRLHWDIIGPSVAGSCVSSQDRCAKDLRIAPPVPDLPTHGAGAGSGWPRSSLAPAARL